VNNERIPEGIELFAVWDVKWNTGNRFSHNRRGDKSGVILCLALGCRKNGPKISIFTQSTPHANLNIMEWYFSDLCRKNRKPGIQKIHVFIAEEKESGVHLSIMNTLKVLVHKIQSFFTICVFEFVNHKYFLYIHSALVSFFFPFSVDWNLLLGRF
jgi:hypothetical protein